MSFESWKAEFYPVSAAVAARTLPPKEVVEHSLRKWIGLRQGNLGKHGLSYDGRRVMGPGPDDVLYIDDTSCSLCAAYYRPQVGGRRCATCPLALARGGFPCDMTMWDNGERLEEDSPYHAGTADRNSDPEPMIMWLEKAKEIAWPSIS